MMNHQKLSSLVKRYWSYSASRLCLMTTMVSLLIALYPSVWADEPIIRVARISLVEGEVSYQRAKDSRKDWYDAEHNLPLDESDQLFSGSNGRAEIQLSGRNIVRIDGNTNLRFTKFNTSIIQLALPIGTATFRIDSLDRRQFNIVDARDGNQDDPIHFEIDTPTVAITLLREGNYRVNVRDDGTTEVIVRRGQAEVYNQEIGEISVKQGRRMIVEGGDNFYQITRLDDKDNWDRWNDRRDQELFAGLTSSVSSRHVPVAIPGVYDLDSYGDWIDTPDYGWVWSPRGVSTGWAPYQYGCWRWYPSYGWTWIAHEPWGWVPYHYGRWAYWGSRWCWVPTVSFGVGAGYGWSWSPHLVVFFGWGGGNYNRGYRDGYWDGFRDGRGWVGWCPLAPGEPHYPRTAVARNVTINNNYPRSVESLRNYTAPGGARGMESRKFISERVIVSNDGLTAPPRGGAKSEPSVPVIVRSDEIKPTQPMAARTTLIERPEFARKLETPVVVRRPSTGLSNPNLPSRSVPAAGSGATVRDGAVVPSGTSRGRDASTSPPTRISDGQIQPRPDRPVRYADYKPVERINPPDKRSSNETRSTGERTGSSGDRTMPSRNVDRQSRSEPAQTSSEPPPQRTIERRESQQPSRNTHRHDNPPARESAPARPSQNSDRPSSPPPSRESAPSRNVERPSSPPSGENAPSRTPERTMPSRKPDTQ